MDLDTYQVLAARTAKVMPSPEADLVHASLGITSEVTEMILAWDAWDTNHWIEEAGDVTWYIALACTTLGAPMSSLPSLADRMTEGSNYWPEVGYFAGTVKRIYIYGKPIDETLRLLMVSSLARLLAEITASAGAALAGGLPVILAANIDKLKLRYPDTYSDFAAEARADKGGLSALES